MSKEKIDMRDVYGEYDPPYNINSNPTKEQIEAAKTLLLKYEERKTK